MERRKEAGESLDVHSVASFFVSRVDTEVDKRLAELGREDLRGIAAVANARAAYQRFKELFRGERFAELREAGAPVQRPLWASTGVKDPQYPETKYVDELVAPDTVNTMPMATLLAGAEKSEVRGATADQDPVDDLKRLADAGIDMEDVTDKLLRDGIDKFVEPFDKLIGGIESAARASSRAAPDDPVLDPRRARAAGRRACAEGAARGRGAAGLAQDETLWGGPGVPEIGNRLGWLTISEKMLEHADELRGSREAGRGSARGAARDGRLEPRPRGDPPLVRRRARGCGCTCSTRPTPARCSRSRRRSTSRRRSSSSPRSRAGRSRRSRT